jgi:hypothetical protein
MMFCDDRAEALRLEMEANARAMSLLQEMRSYIRTPPDALDIVVRPVLYPFSGWAIEADLTWNGEVLRHYESFELLELDLLHLQMRTLLRCSGAGLF